MKCVLFGGGGFIGSAIANRLLLDGHTLRVFERPGIIPYREFTRDEQVEWMHGDLLSQADVAGAMAGMDVVVHLISTTLPKNSNDDPIYDVSSNVIGSLLMLNTMVTLGIKKIVFISSGGTVYGNPQSVPIAETHPTEPLTSYGITKLTIEKYLGLFKHLHHIQPVILRVANPYGARQRLNSGQGAVGTFLHNAMHSIPIQIWGDGSVIRDYIYISDVAEAFAQAIHYDGNETTFNIGSGEGVSLIQVVEQLESVLQKRLDVTYLPARSFDVPANVLNITHAARHLDWFPRISFADGLTRTAEWMRQHG
ncbi:NAD-dependent epimerase/dehydratase family protein [Achromobacter aloeverae]